ncbi:MAG: Mur ligase domain-containing protein [Nitrospirae bacterium]|nr:Mur ligase domain-containing protein [Nitrospirota bacterium]
MKLGDILSGCEYELMRGDEDGGVLTTEISGIAYDSRKVTKNGVFVAVKGEHLDGHDFIDDAVKRGALAVVHEKEEHLTNPPFPPPSQGGARRGQRGAWWDYGFIPHFPNGQRQQKDPRMHGQ